MFLPIRSFLKDLIAGKKKYIKCSSVNHLNLPQYEGLALKDIMARVRNNEEFQKHMPIEKELLKIPKQWVVNIAYSLFGDSFSDWVFAQIEARNAKLAKEKNLMINLDPEIAAAWHSSTAVAQDVGVGANMLKVGSKRRSKFHIHQYILLYSPSHILFTIQGPSKRSRTRRRRPK